MTGRELVRALRKLGWTVVSQKGSHVQLKHPDLGGRGTVPVHAGETLGPALTGSILAQAGVKAEELRRAYETMKAMRTYTIVVEPEEGGGFFVSVPSLPGCFTRGDSVEECQERAVEAIEVHIAGLRADGEQVPEELGHPQLLTVTVAA